MKDLEYIGDWFGAFDDLLLDGNLQRYTKLEVTHQHLTPEIRLCRTSGTNDDHLVYVRINTRDDLAGNKLKQREGILKDLVLHQMCHIVLLLYLCQESFCSSSEVLINWVDVTGHDLALTQVAQVVKDYLAGNVTLAAEWGWRCGEMPRMFQWMKTTWRLLVVMRHMTIPTMDRSG